jgi:hypothetical protein
LQKNFVGALAATTEVDLRHPAGTETGIERSTGSISRDSEILNSSVLGDSESGSDNPAIGLKRGRAGAIKVLIAEVSVHFPTNAECRVDRAIGEIARGGEVVESDRIIS